MPADEDARVTRALVRIFRALAPHPELIADLFEHVMAARDDAEPGARDALVASLAATYQFGPPVSGSRADALEWAAGEVERFAEKARRGEIGRHR